MAKKALGLSLKYPPKLICQFKIYLSYNSLEAQRKS